MPHDVTPSKPNTRRYTDDEKAQAVRLVRQLRQELGDEHGTVNRIANQLGYGTESVRQWVRQSDTDDGHAPGGTTDESDRIKALEQENRELRRANEILRRRRLSSRRSSTDHSTDRRLHRRQPDRVRSRAHL